MINFIKALIVTMMLMALAVVLYLAFQELYKAVFGGYMT